MTLERDRKRVALCLFRSSTHRICATCLAPTQMKSPRCPKETRAWEGWRGTADVKVDQPALRRGPAKRSTDAVRNISMNNTRSISSSTSTPFLLTRSVSMHHRLTPFGQFMTILVSIDICHDCWVYALCNFNISMANQWSAEHNVSSSAAVALGGLIRRCGQLGHSPDVQ